MRFCIITACRNSKFIERCIESVRGQELSELKMIVIDDCSTDDTFERATQSASGDSRIRIIKTTERKYALRNIVESIWTYAGQDDIVVILDGDDYLNDNDVLNRIFREYNNTNADVMWTQHVNSDGTQGNSGKLSGDPITCSWRMSHLRTFKKHLIHGINPRTFLDENGEWWKCAYDQVLYRAIIKISKIPIFFDSVCMVYNFGQGDNVKEIQIETAKKIQKKLMKEFYNHKKINNILLVINGKSDKCDKRFHQGERRFPMGILSLAATLKARGYNVRYIDRFAKNEYWNEEDEQWADVIGITCTTPNFPDALEVLKKLQKHRGKKLLIAGGAHCVLHPEEVKPYVDHVSISEADYEIFDIIERGVVSDNQIRIDNLDSLPLPAYELAYNNKLYNYTDTWDYDDTKNIITMNTSRSCPFSCSFCDVKKIWGQKWSARSDERVVKDVKYLTEKYDFNGIYFREDNFCCSKQRITDICKRMLVNDIKIKWACEMRADMATDIKLMGLMALAGCVGIYIGAESGSNKMLELYQKGITREQIITACKNARIAGINVLMSIIEKHPQETQEDIDLTESMINECKPKRVNRCDYRED